MIARTENESENEQVIASCEVCSHDAGKSPCEDCARALELLQGFPAIEGWNHVAEIASRIIQLPAKERIILEILLLEMED